MASAEEVWLSDFSGHHPQQLSPSFSMNYPRENSMAVPGGLCCWDSCLNRWVFSNNNLCKVKQQWEHEFKCDTIWIHSQPQNNQVIFFIIHIVCNLDTKVPLMIKLCFIPWHFISTVQLSWRCEKHRCDVISTVCIFILIVSFYFPYNLGRFTPFLYAMLHCMSVMMHGCVRTYFREPNSEEAGNNWNAACWHSAFLKNKIK